MFDCSLGKTLQAISILAYLKQFCGINGPHLILTPLSTLGNWVRECERWCPSIKVVKFHGKKEERKQMISDGVLTPGTFDVVVTSYETALLERSALNKQRWKLMIVDEGHRLKNENSILSQVVRFLTSDMRLLLSGTPLQVR
jgi:SWI/SNF-related matrix-associated actin-dependent regulator of chromatin subfamily A member 5